MFCLPSWVCADRADGFRFDSCDECPAGCARCFCKFPLQIYKFPFAYYVLKGRLKHGRSTSEMDMRVSPAQLVFFLAAISISIIAMNALRVITKMFLQVRLQILPFFFPPTLSCKFCLLDITRNRKQVFETGCKEPV